jgi:hypothetical protein
MPAVVAAERSREIVAGVTAEAHTANRRSLVNIVSSRARGSLEPDHVGCGLLGFVEGTVL